MAAPLNAVIMGRKTWESLPVARRPLKDRINIVLTCSDKESLRKTYPFVPKNVFIANSVEEAFHIAQDNRCPTAFLIGGAALITDAIHSRLPSVGTIRAIWTALRFPRDSHPVCDVSVSIPTAVQKDIQACDPSVWASVRDEQGGGRVSMLVREWTVPEQHGDWVGSPCRDASSEEGPHEFEDDDRTFSAIPTLVHRRYFPLVRALLFLLCLLCLVVNYIVVGCLVG
jgi:hypothetical protein